MRKPLLMSDMSWRYALGEFVLIILGVTAALAVDEWRQAKNEQALADEYIVRLTDALEDDVVMWQQNDQAFVKKMRALDRALDWVLNPNFSSDAVVTFLQNLTDGSRSAYGIGPNVTKSIFDELISTGRFGLIQDLEVREALHLYRLNVLQQVRRQTQRETEYAPTVYSLIPRDPEFKVREDLSSDRLIKIARRAQGLDLEGLIIAERNRARLRREIAAELIIHASETIEVLN
jgi:hypothetical protein